MRDTQVGHSLRLMLTTLPINGWTDGQIDRWTDGQTDRWTDAQTKRIKGQIQGLAERWTDKRTHKQQPDGQIKTDNGRTKGQEDRLIKT